MTRPLATKNECLELLQKVGKFLDEDIALLPCTSRQRDLPEETWEYAMFLRDEIDRVVAEQDKSLHENEIE